MKHNFTKAGNWCILIFIQTSHKKIPRNSLSVHPPSAEYIGWKEPNMSENWQGKLRGKLSMHFVKTAEQRRNPKAASPAWGEFMCYCRAEALYGDQLWSQAYEHREGTDNLWICEMVVGRCLARWLCRQLTQVPGGTRASHVKVVSVLLSASSCAWQNTENIDIPKETEVWLKKW